MSRTEGGYDTARLTAAEQDRTARAEREDKARQFLLKRDLRDVAEILGLVDPATPAPRVRRRIGGATS